MAVLRAWRTGRKQFEPRLFGSCRPVLFQKTRPGGVPPISNSPAGMRTIVIPAAFSVFAGGRRRRRRLILGAERRQRCRERDGEDAVDDDFSLQQCVLNGPSFAVQRVALPVRPVAGWRNEYSVRVALNSRSATRNRLRIGANL